jgi:5'-nucleotidase
MRLPLVALALVLSIGSACAEPAHAPHYRILVTNDDGIDAPGIAALAEALSTLGEVVVVAPGTDQSGKAHATSVFTSGVPSVKALMRDGGVFGYAVDGTPADCVMLAVHWLQPDRKFDVVVSGINYGANLGTSSLYSGTLGAALEGTLAGIPSIGVSQDHHRKDFTRSAAIALSIVERVLRDGLAPYTFLNVNIPGGELKGVKIAPMGSSNQALDGFVPMGSAADGTTGLKMKLKRATEVMADTDTAFYLDGYVTVTPLQADWTAYQDIKVLRNWAIPLPAGSGAAAAP